MGSIQNLYHSDIRSMVNFIQINQNTQDWEKTILTDDLFKTILSLIRSKSEGQNECLSEKEFRLFIHGISIQYNMDKRTIINLFFNYLIRNHRGVITNTLLDNIETIVHSSETAIDYTIDLLYRLRIDYRRNGEL